MNVVSNSFLNTSTKGRCRNLEHNLNLRTPPMLQRCGSRGVIQTCTLKMCLLATLIRVLNSLCRDGGNRDNHLDQTCGLSRAPLSWMVNEASAAGLKFTPQSTRGEWRWGSLQKDIPTKSLKTWWYLFEYVPITRLSYTDETSTIRHFPHSI